MIMMMMMMMMFSLQSTTALWEVSKTSPREKNVEQWFGTSVLPMSESLAITVRTSPQVLKTTRCYPWLPSGDLGVSTARPTMRRLAHRRTVGRLGACQELRWLWYQIYIDIPVRRLLVLVILQQSGLWDAQYFTMKCHSELVSHGDIPQKCPIPLSFSRNSFSRKHVLLPLKQPLMKPFLTKMERRLATQI